MLTLRISGYTNHQAVEVLRSTGKIVTLRMARYLRGIKYEQLQQAIASTDIKPLTQRQSGSTFVQVEPPVIEEDLRGIPIELSPSMVDIELPPPLSSPIRTVDVREEVDVLEDKWRRILGPDSIVVVARIRKFKESGGLGISLEGTVDIEDGQEVRPHHYIRAILPDGPVGLNGTLKSGDEILEVS